MAQIRQQYMDCGAPHTRYVSLERAIRLIAGVTATAPTQNDVQRRLLDGEELSVSGGVQYQMLAPPPKARRQRRRKETQEQEPLQQAADRCTLSADTAQPESPTDGRQSGK